MQSEKLLILLLLAGPLTCNAHAHAKPHKASAPTQLGRLIRQGVPLQNLTNVATGFVADTLCQGKRGALVLSWHTHQRHRQCMQTAALPLATGEPHMLRDDLRLTRDRASFLPPGTGPRPLHCTKIGRCPWPVICSRVLWTAPSGLERLRLHARSISLQTQTA